MNYQYEFDTGKRENLCISGSPILVRYCQGAVERNIFYFPVESASGPGSDVIKYTMTGGENQFWNFDPVDAKDPPPTEPPPPTGDKTPVKEKPTGEGSTKPPVEKEILDEVYDKVGEKIPLLPETISQIQKRFSFFKKNE